MALGLPFLYFKDEKIKIEPRLQNTFKKSVFLQDNNTLVECFDIVQNNYHENLNKLMKNEVERALDLLDSKMINGKTVFSWARGERTIIETLYQQILEKQSEGDENVARILLNIVDTAIFKDNPGIAELLFN